MPQASKAIPIYIGWQKGNYPRVNSSQTLHLESRNVQEITANPYGQKKGLGLEIELGTQLLGDDSASC